MRGIGDPFRIRIDARHALWCPEGNRLSVWDNGHWLPEPEVRGISPIRDCLPVFGGRLMLLSNRENALLMHIEAGAVKSSRYPVVANVPLIGDPSVRMLDVDSTGRCFDCQGDQSVMLFEATGTRRLPGIGLPCLEDAAHCIWFVDSGRHVLTMLRPSRIRTEFQDEAISPGSAVVEDKDHTYWTNTTRGLLHLRLGEDRVIEAFGPAHSRAIPAFGVTGMWIDAERNLWLSTRDRLYRVRLP